MYAENTKFFSTIGVFIDSGKLKNILIIWTSGHQLF